MEITFDQINKAEPRLKSFPNKCRCCVESIEHQKEIHNLSDTISQWYFDLTSISLNSSTDQHICSDCFRDLKYCSEFKAKLIDKQNEFQKWLDGELTGEQPVEELESEVKVEFNHVEDCTSMKIECIDVSCDQLGEEFNIPTGTTDSTRCDIEPDDDISECPHCYELFDSTDIPRHVRQNHSNEPLPKHFACDKCSYIATKLNRLERHCERLHQSVLPKTGKKSRRTSEKKIKKQCPTCGIFVKNLSEHQKMVHIQVKRFCCDFCNYSCYFKTKITRHIQKHIPKHLREQFPCDIEGCNFFATRKDALKSHILTMHQTVREKVCLCIECGKSFYNKSQLNIHTKAVHEKVKNHLCNLCGKSFFNIKDMEMHVKRHGVKDLACEVCGNLFYCSLDLRRHLKIHSEPTIACEVVGCGKRFYTNSKLKMHVKIRHEGAKDYFCDYCSSRFSQYNNLKRHVNSVHKSLRINCLIPGCNYSVARKDKYKNHLASQHKFLDEKTKISILKSVKFE